MRKKKMTKGRVYFVDDKPDVCAAVRRTLEQIHCTVRTFTCAGDCLKQLHKKPCNLLIADIRMPGMDGMQLLRAVKRIIPLLPVIVITGYGDVPKAVKAMKAGAEDYIEKPLTRNTLLPPVKSVLKRMAAIPSVVLRPLTPRQLEILAMVMKGMSNREIAASLHRTERTVEDLVGKILKRHGVKNRKELIVQRARLGLL